MFVHTRVRAHTQHAHARMHVHTHARTHVHTHARTCTHARACAHTHSEKAALEAEVRSLRVEVLDVAHLNKMLREEMEAIREEHIPITIQVTQGTVRARVWDVVCACDVCV